MRTLPDYLRNGMKLIIVGCNPGDRSARVGHYYAGRGNEFWPLLYDSRVVPELLDHRDDKRMIEFGIGLTDLVKRPTRGIEELTREEFAEGRILLSQKLEQYAPQVIAFNGVGTFENFAQRPCKPGLQKERLYGAQVFVLPSTSAKNATGRGQKLRYFRQLAKVLEKLPEVGRQGPRHKSVSSVPRKWPLHSMSGLTSSNMGCRILLARGVDGGAAETGIGGFRLLRRENHRESKN